MIHAVKEKERIDREEEQEEREKAEAEREAMELKEALRKSKLRPHELENEHIVDQVSQIVDSLAAEKLKDKANSRALQQDVIDKHKLTISDILIGERRL